MKQLLIIMVAMFVMGSINAQTAALSNNPREIANFKANIENQDLMVKWTSANENSNYWEVQGSTDGKSFSTIGMVMGSDPKDSNTFKFKQKLQKIKPGIIYFRVLHVENDETAEVSNIIQSAK